MVLPAGGILDTGTNVERMPSKTYRIDTSRGVVSGATDGAEAVAQAIWKILNTERFAYLIYSSDYGVTLHDLIGKDLGFVEAELERRIKEALSVDDRVLNASDFRFSYDDGELVVSFYADTVLGPVESAVTYSV